MLKKSAVALMLIAVIAFAFAAASCSSPVHTSASTQDGICDNVSRPNKQQFQNSKPKHHPAPQTPIGRR